MTDSETALATTEKRDIVHGEHDAQERLLALLEACKGKTCGQRVIEILTAATIEGKLIWVRDAAWSAICLIPFLAVSFRLRFPQNPDLTAEWPLSDEPSHLDVVFIDNTRDIKFLPSSFKKEMNALGKAVRESFKDGYVRDRNERLEFLEAALRQFLPLVVSSDPRE